MLTHAARGRLFGNFAYKPEPTFNNPERIRITDGWNRREIVRVQVELVSRTFWLHRRIEPQFRRLLERWNDAGQLDKILTWNGSFNARFIRGSRKSLSNHAWGTAFDINARYNRLGTIPALKGEKGSVRELVKAANDLGFYWGGHYSRKDGMHFEASEKAL